jgi:hypothetical protein
VRLKPSLCFSRRLGAVCSLGIVGQFTGDSTEYLGVTLDTPRCLCLMPSGLERLAQIFERVFFFL